MGTQLGNVTKIYGQKHNTTVTNLNGETIMSSTYLNKNTFIISAPQTINKEDIGTYSLFMTDNEGRPVRLSYTIQPGNGLVIGREGKPADKGDGLDVVSMAIDDYSIKVDDPDFPGAIYVKKENIIDNDTLMVVTPEGESSCIKVITENLDHAGTTATGFGIAQGDGVTITTADGYLTVNTRNLDYADDETDTHGIIDSNTNPYRTVRSDNGILSVWTQNLDRANTEDVGVVKPDGTYTFTDDDGTLTVSNFVYTYSYVGERINAETSESESYRWNEHGIVIPDLVTLGTYEAGEMHVITDGLDKASDSQYGVVKLDGISMGVTTDGLLEVKQYAKLQAIMDVFDSRYTYILNKLNELEGRIVVLETTASAENIEIDIDNSVMTVLSEPVLDKEYKVVSPLENVSVELRVSTNCKFKVSVEYEDNVNPAIVLTQVKLGSNIVVTAAGLQDYEFDSTDDTISQLKLTFECSNYSSNTNESKISTVATIKISSMNDASVYKKAVHTFVRHNTKKYEKKELIPARPIPYPDSSYNRSRSTYINYMSCTDGNIYNNSVPRYSTSSELVKFNIKGPYLSTMTVGGEKREKWTTDKDVLPTLNKPANAGYLGVNVEYYKRNKIDGDLVPDAYSAPWLGYKIETTYTVCHGNDGISNYSYNMLRLYSNKTLSYTNPYRSAKVKFTYYTTLDHTGQSTYTVYYNENIEDKRPTLKLVATLANKDPYIHIDATKSKGALMNGDKWSVTVRMKYVNASGKFVDPTTEHDIECVLSGDSSNDVLTYDFTTKPKITSDVVGCKIVSAYTDSFQYAKEGEEGPKISFVTRNTWNKSNVSQAYSFGNATITKMKVNKWDDLELKIQFDIVPGTTTNIPYGASVKELISTNDGKRTFKFYRGSSSYDWTKYYDTCMFTASNWGTFGTTVTFTFKNKLLSTGTTTATTYGGVTSYNSGIVPNHVYLNTYSGIYETISSPLNHVYSADIMQVAVSNKNRAIPALDYFGYIRFWFALSATYDSTTTSTNFEVSTIGLSDKIGTGNNYFRYNVSIETSLSIINGYYKKAISTSHVSNVGNVLSNTTEFTKTVEELKTTINELKTVESAAILAGVTVVSNVTQLNTYAPLTKNTTGAPLTKNTTNTF